MPRLHGLATAVTAGHQPHHRRSGGITPHRSLTVTAATLVSIAVTPPTPSIAQGTTQQFTATGTYTDNSTQNLTTQVTWASATTSVATISNAAAQWPGHLGRGRHHHDHRRHRRRHRRPITLTVTPATLVSIAVTPPTPSIAKGSTQQFTATGTYTDNSTQNLTTQVTWASATTAVATISNAAGSRSGHLGRGRHQHDHRHRGRHHVRTDHLTVTPATLVSIAVTPPTPSIAKGTTQQFTATGTYTDNSTQNLTTQ